MIRENFSQEETELFLEKKFHEIIRNANHSEKQQEVQNTMEKTQSIFFIILSTFSITQ
jgi:hypothetical protein